MGNRLQELDDKIQKDKKSRYDDRFDNQLEEQSSEWSQSSGQSENNELNWWQKLIYRDQHNLKLQGHQQKDGGKSIHPITIQIPHQQRTVLYRQNQYPKMAQINGTRGGTGGSAGMNVQNMQYGVSAQSIQNGWNAPKIQNDKNYAQNMQNEQNYAQNMRNEQNYAQNMRNEQNYAQNMRNEQNYAQNMQNEQNYAQNMQNEQNQGIANKLIFTRAMQKQSQKIKLNWKPLKQLSQSNNNSNYIYSLLNKLPHSYQLQNRDILFAQYKHQIVSSLTKESSLVVAQKIQINDSELLNHISRHLILQKRKFNQTKNYEQIQQIQSAKKLNSLIYNWRTFISKMSLLYHQQPFPIVALYQTTNSRLNLYLQPKTTIYQQLIMYRIRDIRHLSHLQGVYVLEQALIGFKMLYDVFGYFGVDEQMIGFSCEGKLKVWISEYFWSNMCYSSIDGIYGNEENNKLNARLSKEHQKLHEQQQMVGRIWMIVQKYSLFHQSIVVECQGFRKCKFAQALALIVRHKSSIIDRRNEKQFGLVRFVDRLEFQSQVKSNPITKTNETSKMDSFIGKWFVNRNKSAQHQIPQKNDPKFQHSNNKIQQKPYLFKPQITISSAETNFSSHIKVLQKNRSKQKTQQNQSTKKRRPQIFDRGYNHTMSNNMDQANSEENSEKVMRSHYGSGENLFGNRQGATEHVRFINIRSVK